MDGSDSVQSLLGKKFSAAKSGWLSDAADVIVLLCSFLLITASIVLVALIFHTQEALVWDSPVPSKTLSILQRGISTLSITITSAIIVVAGKRYVLFKLAKGGIRSRRVAVYSRPSIGNLAYYSVRHGPERPLVALLAVWALALVTGLTLSDAWAMAPVVQPMNLSIPFGSFNATNTPGLDPESTLILASGQLDFVMTSVCLGVAGIVGVINVTGDAQLAPGGPTGLLFYPPLPYNERNIGFSLSTSLNGFNISVETLSSIPPTARNLTCNGAVLWYEGGDNQTLSIISITPIISDSLYRFNATPIILGGTLQSTGNTTEFVLNGTTWPIVMSNDRWTQDIASLVCNATYAIPGNCPTIGNLVNFAIGVNTGYDSLAPDGISVADLSTKEGIIWSTVLGMAMGAYSSAYFSNTSNYAPAVPVTFNDNLQFTPRYGVYVLIANIVVSAIMLVVVVRLRAESRLGGDFIDATRLLLDPLKNPELFNASLDTTVDALANPYMLVRWDSKFLLAEQALSKTRMRRTGR